MKEVRMKLSIEERQVSNNGGRSVMTAKRVIQVPAAAPADFKPSRRACRELVYALIRAGYTDEGKLFLDVGRFPNGDIGKLVSAVYEKDEG